MANEKRLIDVNEVIKETESILNFRRQHNMPTVEYEALLGYLKNRPTVDAEPVVHGRWIEKVDMVESYFSDSTEVFYECSVCECANIGESPYCPNCGAKMDGGSEDV